MAQRKRSTGELISSVTFFGAAIWLVFEAKLFLEEGETLKGIRCLRRSVSVATRINAVLYPEVSAQSERCDMAKIRCFNCTALFRDP